MAGLCATRALAGRFGEVMLLDRDDLPDAPQPRRRVPQGRHPHLLLKAGASVLEKWFPGLAAELEHAGAVEVDLTADFFWYQSGGVQRRPASSLRAPSMSRPLLEHAIRERVRRLPRVTIHSGSTATDLTVDASGTRVTGVVVDGAEIAADLVIDATGRQARTLPWLEGLGYPPPELSVVTVNTTYVSRRFRRAPDDARDWKAAAVIGDPESRRLTMALPMEDDQWIVMIGGLNGEAAPSDEVGMLAYARSFEDPVIADLIRDCVPTSRIVTHHFPTNQRRHVEQLKRFPLGWLPLGDAVCSFDPIYGQGMTSAALQAQALETQLDGATALNRSFARAYFKAVARVVAAPWSIAVGGDFVYAGTTGKKPFAADLLNRYTDLVVLAGQRDDSVVLRFNEVVSMVRSPESLLAPLFMLRVLRQAGRVRRKRRRGTTAPAAGGVRGSLVRR
jgi:2-polyprenyl-6-methoxyphenol hydroxylase-like FAD-dependent oxidoreductase